MRLTRAQYDEIASFYECGDCQVELVLVWVSSNCFYIHCPVCATEFQVVLALRKKEVNCPDEEKLNDEET